MKFQISHGLELKLMVKKGVFFFFGVDLFFERLG